MKKILFFIGTLLLTILPRIVKADEPFTVDKTPNCKHEIVKGAQNALNHFAVETFAKIPVENYRSDVEMMLLKRSIVERTQELSIFAYKKYKCDLKGIEYPTLPVYYKDSF